MAKVKTQDKEEKVNLDQIKEELTDYVNLQIKKSFNDEVEKANKRLLREKGKKILFKNIVIIVLLAIIGFLIYLLYDAKYFDKFFNHGSNVIEVVKENKTDTEEAKEPEVKEPTLEELVSKYGHLLDKVTINEKSNYLKDYYDGKLTDELKKYLSLNNIDFKKIQVEEDYNILTDEELLNEYKNLFDDDKYKSDSFQYNENKLRYLNKLESYISDTILEKEKTNIKREIINIKVDNEKVIFTVVEALVKDNKIYNIIDQKEIANSDKKLSEYKDKLNTLTYTFNEEKLVSIKK